MGLNNPLHLMFEFGYLIFLFIGFFSLINYVNALCIPNRILPQIPSVEITKFAPYPRLTYSSNSTLLPEIYRSNGWLFTFEITQSNLSGECFPNALNGHIGYDLSNFGPTIADDF